MRFFSRLLCLLLLTGLSACKEETHIQMGYVSDRDDCYARANYAVGSYTEGAGGISSKDKSTMQTQLFCECMKDHEWSVSGCKFKDKDKSVAAAAPAQQQQPTVVVVQAPPATTPVAAPCPAPKPGKKRPKRKANGVCPAPEEYSEQELDRVLNQQ